VHDLDFPSIFDVSVDGKCIDGRTTEVHVCTPYGRGRFELHESCSGGVFVVEVFAVCVHMVIAVGGIRIQS
jgi:hypothetical protein